MPCRHVLLCLLVLGEDLFQPTYFHPRWLRRNHLQHEIDPSLLIFPDICAECKSNSNDAPQVDFDGEECMAFEITEPVNKASHSNRGATKMTV